MKVQIMNTVLEVSELEVVRLVASVCGYRDLDLEATNDRYTIRLVGPKGPRTVSGKTERECCEAFLALAGVA